ncbi:putative bifunctional diguanylate cyclase/phosphodiesterase [Aurantiacibacter poecillastricola]|uniref:putative bifunctional diguanylate cyclase/phosphodiesterase n=1 Tax=Aurantiacibacter poecillastricola TaxID=3064385 RepID=UPI00273DD328|nr:EAL domain-containing protein [Aurantiacibacter sp. 219JJ12-13]MDP5260058.1 EAL domain-containing protein [Aurantiacibacter sp. 219JJ12-13]
MAAAVACVIAAFQASFGVRPIGFSGILIYALIATLALNFLLSRIREMEALSMTDSLTDLPNRRALHADIAELREKGEELALALIDLDGFKAVNDHHGHQLGDALLKSCAQTLREVCGEEGRFYRLGGDEFAVLVSGKLAGTILEAICRRYIERFTVPQKIENRSLVVGVSAGLASFPARSRADSTEMLRRADIAMYASKTGGRMRCTWFHKDFDRERESARNLEARLRLALEAGELELFYQPLVDARSTEIVAVEALLRWPQADGSSIGPAEFIPIAEETGLIEIIGDWVLERACTDALHWDGIKLSVNVSAAQLRDPDFPVRLGHILEETRFPPERLELEITETYLVGDSAVASRSLDLIRRFGVGVALDDFGTGYASIGVLRKFRFEKLKIDRSLMVEAVNDEGSRTMMASSIAVARALKMDVTAEGVETDQQAQMVRSAGCDQIQGWLYFKAVPATEIEQVLRGGTPAISKEAS